MGGALPPSLSPAPSPGPAPGTPQAPPDVYIRRLPATGSVLFGRDADLAWLDACWDEGVRVAVAMSPSLLAEVVENGGDVRFDSISDNDLALELELDVDALDPTEPEDEFLRMEFEREAEEYDPDED